MRLAALIAALGLAACQTPCPTTGETTISTYVCADGSSLHVTFGGGNAVVEQEGYVTLTLPSRVAGGGFRYADNGAELRSRGTETRWTRPGAAETLCRIVQQTPGS